MSWIVFKPEPETTEKFRVYVAGTPHAPRLLDDDQHEEDAKGAEKWAEQAVFAHTGNVGQEIASSSEKNNQQDAAHIADKPCRFNFNKVSGKKTDGASTVGVGDLRRATTHASSYRPADSVAGTTVFPASVPVDALSQPDAEFELCGWVLRTKAEDIETALHLLDRLNDADIAQLPCRNIIISARYLLEQNQVCGANAILDYAERKKLDVGGAEYLARLITDPISARADVARIEQDIDLIIDYSRRRNVRRMLTERLDDLSSKLYSDIVMALADDAATLQSESDAIARQDPRHISEFMAEVIEEATGQATQSSVMATGFANLDARLNGGVRDGDLVLVGARPGMGKTAFAFGLGRNMSLDTSHNRPVLAFSLEMPGKAQAARLLSAESAVPARILRQAGEIMKHDEYIDLINAVIPRFNKPEDGNSNDDGSPHSRLWIDDTPGLSLAQIRSRARQFVHQYGVRPIIIVDYLQIVSQIQSPDGKYKNQTHSIGMISQGLKSLARELDTPVIALSQLNRSLEQRTNKQPILSDLRESGNLEQDADIILFLYRDVVYNPDTPVPHEAMVIVAKQREGEVGPISLKFDNTLVRFEQ